MDARSHEHAGQGLHGLVSPPLRAARPRRPAAGVLLAAAVPLLLVLGVFGGLLRAGVGLAQGGLAARAAVSHGMLMASVFFGAVIGLERAVALRRPLAWAVPAAALAGGLALAAGWAWGGALLLVLGSCACVAVHAGLLARERVPHIALLGVGALAWLAGNLVQALQPGDTAALAFWFSFLVLTVTAERLEMTRLTRRRAGALGALAALVAVLLAGAGGTLVDGRAGIAFGAALVALAGWLLRHDVARRTVRAAGLPRYMALCLLAGYAWLAVGGTAWALWSAGSLAWRDAALHALGLGFLVSMVLAHAPVILPAVARLKVAFGPGFYLPWGLLHAGLAWRLAGPLGSAAARSQGALANAAALALFALTLAAAHWRWRRQHPA